MPDELRVAVIGAGQMGAFHINTGERVERARLVAVADPDEHAARACIGRRPIEWVADWRTLLERADVDAVVVAVPTELHAEFALTALEAGKHVLVEKPIATTMPDAPRMGTPAPAPPGKPNGGPVARLHPAVPQVQETP